MSSQDYSPVMQDGMNSTDNNDVDCWNGTYANGTSSGESLARNPLRSSCYHRPETSPFFSSDYTTFFLVLCIFSIYLVFAIYACFHRNDPQFRTHGGRMEAERQRRIRRAFRGRRPLTESELRLQREKMELRQAMIKKCIVVKTYMMQGKEQPEGNGEKKDVTKVGLSASVSVDSSTVRDAEMSDGSEKDPHENQTSSFSQYDHDNGNANDNEDIDDDSNAVLCTINLNQNNQNENDDIENLGATNDREARGAGQERNENDLCGNNGTSNFVVVDDDDDSVMGPAVGLDEECLICLGRFHNGDTVCESNNSACRHIFHQECMEHWLLTDHDACPVCREAYLVYKEEKHQEEEVSSLFTI